MDLFTKITTNCDYFNLTGTATLMEQQRFFPNPFGDYDGSEIKIDESQIRNLIKTYVDKIVQNTSRGDSRGDLYVGDAGETNIYYVS